MTSDLIGSGGGIFRVNELQPCIVGIGEVIVTVAEQALPRRGVVGLTVAEIKIEETRRVAVGEFGPDIRLALAGCYRSRRGRLRMTGLGGTHDTSKPSTVVSGGGFEFNANIRLRSVFDELDSQGNTLFGGAAFEHIPLGFDHVGIIRDDFESK